MCQNDSCGNDTAAAEAPLLLRPLLHPATVELTENQILLRQLVGALGSPLNVMLPDVLAPNVQSFVQILTKHGVNGRLFFAHKTTQSDSLLRQLAVVGQANVDVASLNELRHALACGFDGGRLESTGPKNAEFLSLCLLQGVTINVDSIDELLQILQVRQLLSLDKSVRVLLRVSGFDPSPLARASRFGIPLAEMDSVFSLLREFVDVLQLVGFSFHLDNNSQPERLMAISKCLELFEQAVDQGFLLEERILNIGGGFKINYLAQECDWHRYTTALIEAALGRRAPLTWQNQTFGLSADQNGQLRGELNTYEYFERRPGALFLDDLLATRLPGWSGNTVAKVLASNMIELWLEPGRALLDQAGFTIARVNSLRPSTGNSHPLVVLGMKRQDILPHNIEMFVDPVVLYNTPLLPDDVPVDVFFAGSLCVDGDTDLVYRHLTHLPRMPQVGDLVVFANTAGYRMVFSASTMGMHPIARHVAISRRTNGEFTWSLDEQYTPVWPFYEKDA